ncbi:hypothetical protein BRC81_09755 [Halobacteriales archaeon QS_1_68_20]|nr:MAG: hypothetical protein BRC81_09755 [Halobacteriales archaeon QS_1_68_20]
MTYVVAVKPSARRASAEAGQWLNDEGATREFPGRPAADSWARECSSDAAVVYVRDANPGDEDVDGYLMAVRRTWTNGHDDHEEDEPGDQSALLAFRDDEEWQASVQFFDER